MAIWYAQSSGALSTRIYDSLAVGGGSTTTWAAMPETDSVEANGVSITIDVVGWTRVGLSTANGGGFSYALTGDNTITCNLASIASSCLSPTHVIPHELTVVGDVTGGSSSSARGIAHGGTGAICVIGDALGGSGSFAYAIRNAVSATVKVTGSVTGGSKGDTYGISNNSTGTISVNGTVSGAAFSSSWGIANISTGTVTVNGDVAGGTGLNASGISNGSTGIVTLNLGTLVYNPLLAVPVIGENIYFNFGSVSYFKAPGDGPYTLEEGTGGAQGLFPGQTLYP